MARRVRKSLSPTTPLVRQPLRIGALDAVGVVGELRQLHEDAEDPGVERMPADDEVYGALLYAEKHAGALRRLPAERQRAAALKRVLLWEYLRERAEVHQARAVAEARGTGAEWAELAPVLAVKAPSAAYNKAKRLRAAALADEAPRDAEPLRRTPEAVIAAENRIARQKQAEQRAQEAVRRRHHLLVPVAQRLLAQRAGLVLDDDAEYWLDEMAEVLPSCTTATQMMSLSRYLSAAVRALSRGEQRTALPVATTEEARLALAAAVACVAEEM